MNGNIFALLKNNRSNLNLCYFYIMILEKKNMNFYAPLDSLFIEQCSSFQQTNPICFPIQINYQYISPAYFNHCNQTAQSDLNVKTNFIQPLFNNTPIPTKFNNNHVAPEKEISMANLKGRKNIKANIFKDFIKRILWDASSVILIIEDMGSNYSIKKFLLEI